MKNNNELIYNYLDELFPNAECELVHNSPWQLTVAVVMSAQTTDKAVNKVTVNLFDKYPDVYSLANANQKDVEDIIRNIGLYRNKAKNIILLSKQIVENFNGEVPRTMEELTTLAGVGRKSANVIMSVCYNIPAIAVDTHVGRIARRLYIATEDNDVFTIEKKLIKYFPMDKWNRVHHLFIFFGRYKCFSRNPKCDDCKLKDICRYYKYNNKIKNKDAE